MTTGDLARLLTVCDPETPVYVEIDMDRDIPRNLEEWERGTVRFEVKGLEVYDFGVFPELRHIRHF